MWPSGRRLLIADLVQDGVLRQHKGLDAAIFVGAGLCGLRLADMGLGLCRLQSARFGLPDELVDCGRASAQVGDDACGAVASWASAGPAARAARAPTSIQGFTGLLRVRFLSAGTV